MTHPVHEQLALVADFDSELGWLVNQLLALHRPQQQSTLVSTDCPQHDPVHNRAGHISAAQTAGEFDACPNCHVTRSLVCAAGCGAYPCPTAATMANAVQRVAA